MTSPPALHRDTSFMEAIGLDDWKRWQQQGCTRLPVVKVWRDASLPSSWSSLTAAPATVLLESALAGRYSYVCDRPARVIFGHADAAEIWSADCATLLERRGGKPLELLREILASVKTPVLPDVPTMQGGLIGVFGYDLVRTWERLPLQARRDLDLPLYVMIETAELFIYDHAERTLHLIVWSEIAAAGDPLSEAFQVANERAQGSEARWRSSSAPVDPSSLRASAPSSAALLRAAPEPSFSSEQFQTAVRRVKDFIAAGDTYQVNLSRRTSRAVDLAPAEIYEGLRRVNPSPYMGLLRLPAFSIVCGSPELLVRLVDGVVSSRPIAGTRPRGAAAADDAHFSAELFASEKERAEHLMLVDLIRNDIGRVAAFGSVRVRDFMVLERYSHVMHLVSQVEGRLAADATWVDVLRAMFPGGTITGCPKFRTLEIIEELEPVGRGFYTGALGWISYGGAMEMNIVIRTMLVQNGIAHVQAGAGIVADSRPEQELDEATRKAQALWAALEAAEAKLHG